MEEYKKVLIELDDLMRNIGKHFIPDLEILNEFHLTKRQVAILFLILKKPETTISEIAQYFEISKSAVSQSMTKLEEEDIIIREINHDNRREMNLILGQNGQRIQHELFKLEQKMMTIYLTKLPIEDLHHVRDTLKKLDEIIMKEKKDK
ncbi:MarR family winged helix-turn-helix transcriptional regulator [Alkalihalophilus lindianensis]|uniref:MarR family winged helix-turn-helix transcriptional regulator n=1 Tax=Alkalihalophilus lindianensis TaxID=1630542 RepID=A0ABU3X7R3_9BACI|nr:MarR family winged helix-turn-helix transcriptional regulator [Alkalihalophilus lindianensis]MDV2683936.1 MarR family winged helix-turn-helix transcriptional regulator [Alkalihalophilus lindianensis]